MAATNYTPIQLYYSTTASAAPTAGNLTSGELAINITDGKLYYKDNGGVVQVIATKGAGTIGGSTTQIQYNNAGALAGSAAMTFNSGTNVTTLTTLNLTNALGATYGGTAQSAYTQGDVLYASATNTLSKLGIGTVNYILTSTGSVPQWVAPSSVTVQTANNLAGGAGGSVPYQSAADTTTFLAIGAANRVMTSSGTAPQWVTALTGLTGVSSSSITNTSLTAGRVVLSTTAGLQTDDADLTFDGTTLSSGGYSTTGLSTLVKTVKIGDSNFSGVAVFAPSTPAKLYIGTGTVTDTTSAIGATNATGAVSSLAITPIAATNTSVTYTNASTLYIAGAPSAGTNVTLTNPYALYVAAGASYLNSLSLGTVLPTTSGGTGLTSFTSGGVVYASSSSALTTGSALTFDGSTLTVSASVAGTSLTSSGAYSYLAFANSGGATKAGLILTNSSGILQSRAETSAWTNYDGSSEYMRLTSTGLGIGTSSVSYKLDVQSGSSPTIRIKNTALASGNISQLLFEGTNNFSGTSTSFIQSIAVASGNSNTALVFGTNAGGGGAAAEVMRLDYSGNLGLGVTPSAWNTGKALEINAVGTGLWGAFGNTYLNANNYYNAADKFAGTGYAVRYLQVPSNGQHQWLVSTASGTAGNAITFTQAMSLTAAGQLLVGTTGGGLGNTNSMAFQPADGYSIFNHSGTATGTKYFYFGYNGTEIGSVTQSGTTAVLYNVMSDQRLKENITDAAPASSLIDSLQVRQYDWKSDGSHQRYGFVAQELVTVAPEAVHQPADADEMMAVDYSKLVPMLVKEIQSLRKRLTALEGKA